MMMAVARDYPAIVSDARRRLVGVGAFEQRLRVLADCLWDHLSAEGVSWVGFYLEVGDRDEMVLGPSQDKPACSPIGLHGACGRALVRNEPLIVRDVKTLGENYVACDPRDRSEVVLPIYRDGSTIPCGVLDLDSFDLAAFDDTDVQGLQRLLTAAGLSPADGYDRPTPATEKRGHH